MKILVVNKKLNFNYSVIEKIEAGIELKGVEVKSIHLNNANISDAYVIFRRNQAYILNMHIAPYSHGNIYNVEPLRTRKLLLHKKEIIKYQNKIKKEALTMVPSKVYWKRNKLKVEIALVKGKKVFDKRESIKDRDNLSLRHSWRCRRL
ncbi:MAG: SsrA-binding protein, partial [Malacoplasma sp.]|nr:SsrA-binding protein [Malacoplasma sp.]